MSFFDDLLKRIPAEDQTVLAKYPEIQASVQKMETDLATMSGFTNRWVNWQNEYWDGDAGMTKNEKFLTDRLAEAEANLVRAAAPGSGASATEIANLRKELDAKVEAVAQNSLRTIEGMNAFYGAAYAKQLPHQQEFGENLNPKALLEFMQVNKINDPDMAYDRMFASKRSEIATKRQAELDEKHKVEIQEAEKKGYEKRAQELAMGPSGVQPTDSTGGIAGVTAFMGKPAAVSDDVKAKVADAKVGDGSLAALGYDLYRQGAFATTQ